MIDFAKLSAQQAGEPARRVGRLLPREIIGPPACPIMHRWTLLRVGGRKLIVHHFLPGSEDMSTHDHPAPFWTLVLRGGYQDVELCAICRGTGWLGDPMRSEWTCDRCHGAGELLGDQMRPGMLRYRPARHAHRTCTLPVGAWTVVVMGRKQQPWGFWSRGRWWPWRDHEKAFGFGMRCPEPTRNNPGEPA